MLREAMHLCRTHQLQCVNFESDNLDPVNACRGDKTIREVQNILQNITFLKTNFEFAGFTWVGRKWNIVAHEIAALSSRNELSGN